VEIPQFKQLRWAYGFDDVTIAPGEVTANPDQTDVSLELGGHRLELPILAASLDAVSSPEFAIRMGQLGGLAVINLEGLYTRYDDLTDPLQSVIDAPLAECTALLQKLYSAPIREELIAKRIKEVKSTGVVCSVAVTPQNTKRFAPVVQESGADILMVQSTVTTARHVSKSYRGLVFSELVDQLEIPLVVGNCVTYNACLELMEEGVDGVLVGVGPGAICTTREVVGVGVPQVTATLDCAAAREEYRRRKGRYVPIITDGGMRTGGDMCKAFASGADGVMLGTTFAQAKEAPGRGYSWGMASPHPALPRGTRINVGTRGTLEQILFGPSGVTDGTQNLVGALRAGMGMVGALNLSEFQKADLLIAPAIKTEGKFYQIAQGR
jgi:IMP dehydrogenase